MGLFSAIQSLFSFSRRDMHIVFVGLDNSGKTTLLSMLKQPEGGARPHVVPTVGSTQQQFAIHNLTFTAIDFSGQGKYRTLWEGEYARAEGIVFVVDSADRLRIAVARDELWLLLDHEAVRHKRIPLLVLANKADVRTAVSCAELSQSLGLDMLRGRPWHLAATCALDGSGISDAFSWLATQVQSYVEESSNSHRHK